MRKMIPVKSEEVRKALKMRRAEVAREAGMQPGVIAWIETGRYIPYESQIEKIAEVYRRRGWEGKATDLLEEVV